MPAGSAAVRVAVTRAFRAQVTTGCYLPRRDTRAQDMALTHNFGMFSNPMNHDEFLKQLG
jgi:hypothetical protein